MRKSNKQHYPWWSYIKHIIRTYPASMEQSGAAARGQEAVRAAIQATSRMKNGDARLKVIRLVHWERTHTLEGAAQTVPCGRATAARWQRRFFEEVARNRDLLD